MNTVPWFNPWLLLLSVWSFIFLCGFSLGSLVSFHLPKISQYVGRLKHPVQDELLPNAQYSIDRPWIHYIPNQLPDKAVTKGKWMKLPQFRSYGMEDSSMWSSSTVSPSWPGRQINNHVGFNRISNMNWMIFRKNATAWRTKFCCFIRNIKPVLPRHPVWACRGGTKSDLTKTCIAG